MTVDAQMPSSDVRDDVLNRANQCCELCGSGDSVDVLYVLPKSSDAAHCIAHCASCQQALPGIEHADYWRCLGNAMWSIEPAVQVTVWRILNALKEHSWAADWLGMMVLEDDVLAWAQSDGSDADSEESNHKDANGHALMAGDTVVLIKDLDVKGANFTAKRGTAVRGISLVSSNSEHIEGRVNGQRIVILTKFVKKA